MTRVMIVDPDAQARTAMGDLLHTARDIQQTGMFSDGLEAHEALLKRETDVLITEMVMPRMDGLALLESAAVGAYGHVHVIVLTSLAHERCVNLAAALGAAYYMIKPFIPDVLLSRVRGIHTYADESCAAKTPRALLEDRITNHLIALGMPAHINGFQYLRDAVILVKQNTALLRGITKELYPCIAKTNQTTPSRVERAIRSAIEALWNRGSLDVVSDTLGIPAAHPYDRPSNREFIALLAKRLA